MALAIKGLALSLLLSLFVFAAIPTNSSAQEEGWIVKTSGAGSLDIMLEQVWTEGGMLEMNISFFHPNTTRLHEHQDYDLLILQGDQQVFSAAGAINQPLIHNVPGTVRIPQESIQLQPGEYTVEVHVLGLGFPPLPINPEVATFPITVVPEFPAALTGVIAALVASSIVLTRRIKLF